MGINIIANIENTTGGSAPGSYANVPGLSVTGITPAGTNSVFLIFASVAQTLAADATAAYRFAVTGKSNSPELTAFVDSTNEGASMSLSWAVTGLSGSVDFAVQWESVQGSPAKDTTRNSTLLILEITGGEAVLEYDGSSVASFTPTGSWANVLQSGSITSDGLGQVWLFLSNIQMGLSGDHSIDFQFAQGTTKEGAITSCHGDSTNEASGWSGVHAKDGVTGSVTFAIQARTRSGSPTLSTSYRRTFQVIQMDGPFADLVSSIVTSVSNTPSGTWTDDNTLDDTVYISSVSSVVLQIFNGQIGTSSSDATAENRLTQDGAHQGPQLACFNDWNNGVTRNLLVAAQDGLAGNTAFATQWRTVQGTPLPESSRDRSQFVIEFTPVTYQIDGFTLDKDGDALGSCGVYVFRDNGASPLTYIGYALSNATTGAFSVTGIGSDEASYVVYAYKASSPHVMDVSDHNIEPDDGTNSVDLYLRSNTDKGETASPADHDLRLRSDADKEAQAVEIATTLRAYLYDYVTVGSTLRGYLQASATIGSTLRAYLGQEVKLDTTLRAYLYQEGSAGTVLRGYLQASAEVTTDLRGYLLKTVEVATDLRGYLYQYNIVETQLRAYLQRSDVEVGTTLRALIAEFNSIGSTLRGYLQALDVQVATTLRGYLQQSDIEIATTLRSFLQQSDVEIATTLRGYLTRAVGIATPLRAYLNLHSEISTDLRGHLSQNYTVGSTLRAYLEQHVEVSTDLRGYLQSLNAIGTLLRGYLQALDVEVATTLRGHLSENVTVGSTLRGHLSENVAVDSTLRGHLFKTEVVESTLRGHTFKTYEVNSSLRAHLIAVTPGQVESSLRGYLQKSDIEITTDLRAYLANFVEISTALRSFLQRSDIEIDTTLRGHFQKYTEISTTLRGHLSQNYTISSSLRAYLAETTSESTTLRAYLSKLGVTTSTTLSAYLLAFEFIPHWCFKASPREKFIASEREKFIASEREKFSSATDSCPYKED